MSYRQKRIDRIVFGEVPETCPHVDAALEAAAEKIKEQTIKLREALSEYVERAVNAEEQLEDAQAELKELRKYVEDLENEIQEMVAS